MKSKYRIVLTLCMAFVVHLVVAQKTVIGTVSDESGLPLPGVNVIVEGTTSGTQTDFDGNYSLQASEGDVLSFSFVGFASQDVLVQGSSTYNIILQESTSELDEVIVTGQGAGLNRRRIPTTVDVVKAEEIEKIPAQQVDQLLQGAAPGAQIRLSSGQPGTASIIRTRGPITANGNSTPVVLVDGVRVDNLNSTAQLGNATGGAQSSSLADIPLGSIERIEYIKGSAAATLYGADAANGVIQIFTKKGKFGKAKVDLELQTGVIAGTRDFLKYDETGDLYFESGNLQNLNLGVNGGGEKFRYNFSGNLYFDDSFNRVNEQLRRNFRFGFTADISEKLKYSASLGFSNLEFTRDYNANTNFSIFANLEAGDFGDLSELSQADLDEISFDPLIGIREQENNTDITDRIRRFQASNKFTYLFSDNFEANFIFGLDSRYNRDELLQTNRLLISKSSVAPGTTDQGSISRSTRQFLSVTGEINLQHRAYIGEDFSFITNAGSQFFRNDDFQQNITGQSVIDGVITLNGSNTTTQDFQRTFTNYGFFLAENIGFRDKLYLDLGGRLDANSAFGDEIGFLFLPKIGLSYSLSNEAFFADTFGTIWSNFRIRANYGEATNFPTAFAQERTVLPRLILGTPTIILGNQGDENLKSERVKTTEFGVDLGFFNNRLNLGFTYYDGVTEDALFTPPAIPSGGRLNQLTNIGEISNTGVEFSLQGQILESKKHSLSTSFSYNYNENLVESSGGAPEFNVGGFQFLGAFVKEGLPLGYLRGSRSTIGSDGQPVIERNENLGQTFAPHFGSFSLNYTFNNNFNFFLNGDYQFGGQFVIVDDVLRFFNGVNDEDRFPEDIQDYQANPGAGNRPLSFFDLASYWVEDSDYIKIRNIGVSYNLNVLTDNFKYLDNLRLGFNIQNPINWSKSGVDPEATGAGLGNNQGSFAGGGFAFGTISAPRTYLLSLKATF